ncbi:PepSY-associated TM helix domain-containing protein [Deinococcus lacus]|uniref:PepSY-associated TM helix domain-containing protein n=1 Tax=Deinococcus lacus TaxID=392561 RepID=A0ABW1YJ57_9DEIO
MSAPNTAPPELQRAAQRPIRKPWRVRVQVALRSLHIYTSMATLLLILFFSLSGLLLNHPEWIPAGVDRTQEYSGQLSPEWLNPADTNWLEVVETLRANHDLRGRAAEFQNDGTEATLSFLGPGREALVTVAAGGHYTVEETSHGLLALLGDLHRGHQTGPGWRWVIDLTALFLTFISATGFGILLYLKKLRRPALLTLLAGSIVGLGATLWLA